MRPPSAFPFSPSRNLGRVTARPRDGESKGFPSSDSSVPPCATLSGHRDCSCKGQGRDGWSGRNVHGLRVRCPPPSSADRALGPGCLDAEGVRPRLPPPRPRHSSSFRAHPTHTSGPLPSSRRGDPVPSPPPQAPCHFHAYCWEQIQSCAGSVQGSSISQSPGNGPHRDKDVGTGRATEAGQERRACSS